MQCSTGHDLKGNWRPCTEIGSTKIYGERLCRGAGQNSLGANFSLIVSELETTIRLLLKLFIVLYCQDRKLWCYFLAQMYLLDKTNQRNLKF